MPDFEYLKENFLPFVTNPAQYIGQEINVIKKDWDRAQVRVALGFPDAYTIGSSSLAVAIIYDLLNRRGDALCERTFCPMPDAADRMRELRLPLFTLESRRPVRQFDVLALSVQYEMLYSNVLELLDLAGITLHADQRRNDEPIVLIGGSQANNAEPLADFIDLAILGEAEASLPQFVDLFAKLKGQIRNRRDLLIELARNLPWLYAPALYNVRYRSDGSVETVEPAVPDLPMPVTKAVADDFDNTPAPTRPIIPYVQTVHERINIEIMRGCPHACRFCHEGHTRRPLRYRSPETIIRLARETFANTGLTEISLCGLSSADHPQLTTLFAELNRIFVPQHVSISLPSLRAEKQLELVPEQTAMVRKSPLTIAIESADPTVRNVINKPIDEDALFAAVKDAYRCGWKRVKLYFIVGLPGETPERLPMIVDLADRIARLRTEVARSPAQVTASISFFVPKPHTPLQWVGQPSVDCFQQAQTILRDAARSKRYITLKFHNRRRSHLEAVFARGDRRLGAALHHAWRSGARFDAWDDEFRHEHYDRAFDAAGIDPVFYARRHITTGETLPWDHLKAGLDKPALLRQLARALEPLGGLDAFFAFPGPTGG